MTFTDKLLKLIDPHFGFRKLDYEERAKFGDVVEYKNGDMFALVLHSYDGHRVDELMSSTVKAIWRKK